MHGKGRGEALYGDEARAAYLKTSTSFTLVKSFKIADVLVGGTE